MTKGFLIALLAAVVGFTGWNAWQKGQLRVANAQLNNQLMKANLDLGRAETQFGDAQKKLGLLDDELQASIKARNESLTMYGTLLAKYNAKGEGKTVYLPGATEVIEVPVESDMKFHLYNFYWAETEKTLRDLGAAMPSGFEDHRVFIKTALFTDTTGEITFGYNYELKLKLLGELVQTTTESGSVNHYLTMWELDDQGKKVGKFQLTKFDVVVNDNRVGKFFWFAPHLDLGIVGGFDGQPVLGGSVGVSLSGYGYTKNDLSFRFARVGMTLAENPGLELSPVLFNLGGPIPLVSNIWIGPAATFNGKWGGALLLNVVL